MQSLLKKLFIFIICFFFLSVNVKAIVCEYPDAGLNITYDENSQVTIDHEKFKGNQYYQNLLGIVKWGSGQYNTDAIEIDQTLFEKYQGKSCPDGMYVCEYGNWSISGPSLTSVGLKIGDLFTQIPCWMGMVSKDACNYMNEEGWSLLTLGEKKLYIYTFEQYQNSDLPKYEGGLLSDDLYVAADEWYDRCSGGSDAWYAKLGGAVCWVGGGLIDGGVGETLLGDGVDIFYRYANCNNVSYSGPYASFNVNCAQLTQKFFKFTETIYEYKTCIETGNLSCKSSLISQLREQEDSMKAYCSNILQNYDYVDGQKNCINDCFKLKDKLNNLKKGTDLYVDYSVDGECGVSHRLIVWLINIFRWIKYILPVVVIILGILDFIKAIGADKDDEIKKAQGRFIRRLIAAALVFIIPLILEFVLTKMGFGYDSCSLF